MLLIPPERRDGRRKIDEARQGYGCLSKPVESMIAKAASRDTAKPGVGRKNGTDAPSEQDA